MIPESAHCPLIDNLACWASEFRVRHDKDKLPKHHIRLDPQDELAHQLPGKTLAYSLKLPSEVGEGTVGFGHFVHVFALFNGVAGVIEGIGKFLR